MTRTVTVEADVEDWIFAELKTAVAAGEASSVQELVGRIVTEDVVARRNAAQTYDDWARAKVEEALHDTHPGFPAEDVFAEARSRLTRPQSKAS